MVIEQLQPGDIIRYIPYDAYYVFIEKKDSGEWSVFDLECEYFSLLYFGDLSVEEYDLWELIS